jgi:hypothetical protein
MCMSSPSYTAPPPAPPPQEAKQPDSAASSRKRMTNNGAPQATLLTGPTGIEQSQVAVGRTTLLGQ